MPSSRIPVSKSTSKANNSNSIKKMSKNPRNRGVQKLAAPQLGGRSKSVITTSSTGASEQGSSRPASRAVTTRAAKTTTKPASSANTKTTTTKKQVADRRGISEIKRSENELKNQVERLKQDISDLHETVSVKTNCVQECETTIEELHNTIGKLEDKKQSKVSMMRQLEKSHIDPVTLNLIKNEELLTEMEKEKEKEAKLVTDFLQDLDSIEMKLNNSYVSMDIVN